MILAAPISTAIRRRRRAVNPSPPLPRQAPDLMISLRGYSVCVSVYQNPKRPPIRIAIRRRRRAVNLSRERERPDSPTRAR
jgi:hypothetical protein